MKRPITINIHSLIEKFVVNDSSKEDIENMEKKVTEALLRVLASARAVSLKAQPVTKTLEIKNILDITFKKETVEDDLNSIKEYYNANPGARVAGRIFMFLPETSDNPTT